MPELMETLTSNPLLIVVVAVLVLFIVIGIVKKLIKLALFFAIGLALFVAYLMFTGQELPPSLEGIKQTVEDKIDQGKEFFKEPAEENAEE